MKTKELVAAIRLVKEAQKLGTGARFTKLEKKLSGKVSDPGAVAASIGRKKYGDKKMTQLSQKGKADEKKSSFEPAELAWAQGYVNKLAEMGVDTEMMLKGAEAGDEKMIKEAFLPLLPMLLPALAGVAGGGLGYLLGKRKGGRDTGLLAGAANTGRDALEAAGPYINPLINPIMKMFNR